MSVFIGVAAGRGNISHVTAASIFHLQAELRDRGFRPDIRLYAGADVFTARNVLGQLFMESECSTFVGIDDDVGFTINAFNEMFEHREKVIGAFLPQRIIDLRSFAAHIQRGMNPKDAFTTSHPRVGEPSKVAEGAGNIIPVKSFPAGFYMFTKTLLKTMISKGLAHRHERIAPNGPVVGYGFYDPIMLPDGGYMADDFAFCYRAVQAGFELLGYRGPGISHTGMNTFYS